MSRWSGAEGRESAPLGTAGAPAYALLGENAGRPTEHGVFQVLAVVAAALLGCVPAGLPAVEQRRIALLGGAVVR